MRSLFNFGLGITQNNLVKLFIEGYPFKITLFCSLSLQMKTENGFSVEMFLLQYKEYYYKNIAPMNINIHTLEKYHFLCLLSFFLTSKYYDTIMLKLFELKFIFFFNIYYNNKYVLIYLFFYI